MFYREVETYVYSAEELLGKRVSFHFPPPERETLWSREKPGVGWEGEVITAYGQFFRLNVTSCAPEETCAQRGFSRDWSYWFNLRSIHNLHLAID